MGERARKLHTPPADAIATALLYVASGGLSARRRARSARARALLDDLATRCPARIGGRCDCGLHARRRQRRAKQ